jgi:alkyl sulfatase BDS1-like metallo-beta-lactamase superfamily hydrolase
VRPRQSRRSAKSNLRASGAPLGRKRAGPRPSGFGTGLPGCGTLQGRFEAGALTDSRLHCFVRKVREMEKGLARSVHCNRGAALTLLLLAMAGGVARAQEFGGREKLRAHSAEFRREVIEVADGVWVAVGFSDSNSILIAGDGGSIVIDTTSDVEDATRVRAEFAKLTSAPVRAIIYTHSHPDHTGGASVFAGDGKPEIIAHRLFVDRVPDVGRAGRDGGDQFGSTLPDALFINAGTGLEFGRHPATNGYLPPTRTFSEERLELTIAGVRLQLIHTPGETRENIAVWLPDRRVLLPGDDFYKAFPTLYAIRGARLRPIDQWITSLGTMIELGADSLAPGHTRPVLGRDSVRAALTAYRDGIKSVVDQTLEGMRKGERPDELVQHVALPSALAENPFLQEFYGTVAWSVRGIYSDYAGWFDGNPAKLFPLAESERATRIIDLAGGREAVLATSRRALAGKDFQWAAELADYVLAVDSAQVEARRLKAAALSELGERQISAIARNYYLSAAQYLLKGLPPQ